MTSIQFRTSRQMLLGGNTFWKKVHKLWYSYFTMNLKESYQDTLFKEKRKISI